MFGISVTSPPLITPNRPRHAQIISRSEENSYNGKRIIACLLFCPYLSTWRIDLLIQLQFLTERLHRQPPRTQNHLPSQEALILSAATALPVHEVALLHAVNTNILAPLAAVLLTLGSAEPTGVAGVVARGASLELGEGLGVLGRGVA